MLAALMKDLGKLANREKATLLMRFFKTGVGQYGEGDIFLGISVPAQRLIAKKYEALSLPDIQKLLKSKIHEHRLIGFFILVDQYKKADENLKKKIYDFYLAHAKCANNWDLVDSSADKIVGKHLLHRPKDRKILQKLVRSKNVWERRISVVATYEFIRNKQFDDTFAIVEKLLADRHDLIHKACGWMLREVGKKDRKALETFLMKHHKSMPRTMLRYSIEHFDPKKRAFFMARPSNPRG